VSAARRWGRWAYDNTSTLYGVAGWHLDGSPVVIDFMPGVTDGEPGRGLYLGYNWPGRDDGWFISKYCAEAMRLTGREWDESPFAVTQAPGGPS
jgi:hypothetical protein